MYESGGRRSDQSNQNQMDLRDKLSDDDREESQARIEESTAEKEAARREADRAETKYGGLLNGEKGDDGE
jgi:hypothetical protein